MFKALVLSLVFVLFGCATTQGGESACATCGLGGEEREALAREQIKQAEEAGIDRDVVDQMQVAENQQQWARYFVSNMVNAEFEAIPDSASVNLSFSFHNNTNYRIDELTFQLGEEVWVDDLGASYVGCRPTSDCYSRTLPNGYHNSSYLSKTKFCSKMNGNIWLTHVHSVKLDNPVNLMPQKATFCEVTQ